MSDDKTTNNEENVNNGKSVDWADALEEQINVEEDNVDWSSALEEDNSPSEDNLNNESKVNTATLKTLEDEHDDNKPKNEIEMIMDIPVNISMEVGRTHISIRNLLKLNQGSVVELDRFAGEPLDVMVNGTLIAHGEVVVINDKFGIRLTDVMSQAERIQKIK